MMGDNRGESDDSRFWGPVPRAWIIGKAFFTYWPPEPDRVPLRLAQLMASHEQDAEVAIKSVIELVVTVAVAVGLALLIQAFIVKPYRIPSPSMEPTLHDRPAGAHQPPDQPPERRRHRRLPPAGAAPIQRNATSAANPNQGGRSPCSGLRQPTPQESSQTFIKRVVGGPGDTIAIINGHVIPQRRAGEGLLHRASAATESFCNFRKPIKIPPGDYFMMGDNRGASDDSRFWGPVPDKWVIGVAFFTYWPPDRIGFL